MITTRELYVSDYLITGPTVEPIDLDEVKRHLRFTSTSEDTLLDTYIAMARQYFEEATGRQLMAATWERRIEGFPWSDTSIPYNSQVIELPHPPLLSVVSVTHAVSGSPDQTPLTEDTDYSVEAPTGPYAARGLVWPVSSWPSITSSMSSVRIQYRAGYGDAVGDVPELIKGALYLLVGHFHKFRSEFQDGFQGSMPQLPIGADSIIRGFKYSALPRQPYPRTAWPA